MNIPKKSSFGWEATRLRKSVLFFRGWVRSWISPRRGFPCFFQSRNPRTYLTYLNMTQAMSKCWRHFRVTDWPFEAESFFEELSARLACFIEMLNSYMRVQKQRIKVLLHLGVFFFFSYNFSCARLFLLPASSRSRGNLLNFWLHGQCYAFVRLPTCMLDVTQLLWGRDVNVPCSCKHGQCYVTAGMGGRRGFAVNPYEHVEQSCDNSPFGSFQKTC